MRTSQGDEEHRDAEGKEETDHQGQEGSEGKGICTARRPRME